MSYQDKELDEIALKASMISDKAERQKIYKRIQEIVVRDIPYINLMNEQKTTIIRAGWSGFNVEESGFDTSYTWFGYYSVKPPGRS
jgi:peptide/nickel transport system substrate-binding protein